VEIADSADELIAAAERILTPDYQRSQWLQRVDNFLAGMSWDQTWSEMAALIDNAVVARKPNARATSAMPAVKASATASVNAS